MKKKPHARARARVCVKHPLRPAGKQSNKQRYKFSFTAFHKLNEALKMEKRFIFPLSFHKRPRMFALQIDFQLDIDFVLPLIGQWKQFNNTLSKMSIEYIYIYIYMCVCVCVCVCVCSVWGGECECVCVCGVGGECECGV